MKRREFNKNISILGLAAPLFPSLLGSNKSVKQKYIVTVGDSKEFLPKAGSFNIKTNPVLVITHEGKKEVLVFSSEMKVATKTPSKDNKGFRQVDLQLQNWEANAYSNLLGKNIGFRVTDSFKSTLTSTHLNQDFPSKLELNIEYDILIDGQVVEKGVSGRVSTALNSFVPNCQNILHIEGGNFGSTNQQGIGFNLCAA